MAAAGPAHRGAPGNLQFLRYSWVCSNQKLKETLGWQPKHDTRETFLQTMRARGVIAPAAGEEAAALAAVASPNGGESAERAEVS